MAEVKWQMKRVCGNDLEVVLAKWEEEGWAMFQIIPEIHTTVFQDFYRVIAFKGMVSEND